MMVGLMGLVGGVGADGGGGWEDAVGMGAHVHMVQTVAYLLVEATEKVQCRQDCCGCGLGQVKVDYH